MNLRAPVQVAAFLDRFGQAERLPQVRHPGIPVTAQHLEDQAHAEQPPGRAGRISGFLPDGQRTAHQFLFGGHVGIGWRHTIDQPGDVAVMKRHPQAADGEGLTLTVASPRGQRLRLGAQPLRRGEIPGTERGRGQRLVGRRARRAGGPARRERHGVSLFRP